jgi:hypothetical protein
VRAADEVGSRSGLTYGQSILIVPPMSVDTQIDLSLLLTAGIAILGWYVVSRLASNRDRDNARREIRVEHLLNAYRNLESITGRPFTDETVKALESAMTEIQLLGSADVVNLADRWVEDFNERGERNLTPLAAALRSELRKELGLEQLNRPPRALRITIDDEEVDSDP